MRVLSNAGYYGQPDFVQYVRTERTRGVYGDPLVLGACRPAAACVQRGPSDRSLRSAVYKSAVLRSGERLQNYVAPVSPAYVPAGRSHTRGIELRFRACDLEPGRSCSCRSASGSATSNRRTVRLSSPTRRRPVAAARGTGRSANFQSPPHRLPSRPWSRRPRRFRIADAPHGSHSSQSLRLLPRSSRTYLDRTDVRKSLSGARRSQSRRESRRPARFRFADKVMSARLRWHVHQWLLLPWSPAHLEATVMATTSTSEWHPQRRFPLR